MIMSLRSMLISIGFDIDHSPLDVVNDKVDDFRINISDSATELMQLTGSANDAVSEMTDMSKTMESIDNRPIDVLEQNTKDLNDTTNDLTKDIKEFDSALDKAGIEGTNSMKSVADSAESVSKKTNEATNNIMENFDKVGSGMQDIGSQMSIAITAPLTLLSAGAMKVASDMEASQGKIQAQLGVTASEAEELSGVAQDLWENAFGANLDEVTNNVAIVKQNIQDLNDEDLQSVTESAYILQDAFGAEISESTRAASVMMKNFGISADEAFDLMTVGFQKGGNYSDELLDTMREYSPQFATMGHSAEDMMNILISGANAGAFNLDKVGDAVKEFNIRAKDGSDTTAEGFAAIGMNAEQMGVAIANGGVEGEQAFQATIAALAAMEDPILQNQAGVALFGTQWEDLENNVISAMGTTENVLGDVEGATNAAGEVLYDNFGTRLTEATREGKAALEPLGNVLLDIAEDWLPKISSGIEGVSSWFSDLSPNMQQVIVVSGGLLAVLGPILAIFGAIISFVPQIVSGFKLLAAIKLGALIPAIWGAVTATWSFTAALLANPITWVVIGVVALIAAIILLWQNWDSVTQWIGEKLTWLLEVSVSILTSIGQFFSELWSSVVAWTTESWSTIVTNVTNFVTNLWTTITTKFTEIVTSISTKMGEAKQWIMSIWNEAQEFLSSINLFEIGRNIIQGLSNGIKSMASSVLESVTGIASSIKDTVTGFFGIRSPSRLMMEYGNDIGEGLSIGIDDSNDLVASSAGNLSESAYRPEYTPQNAPVNNNTQNDSSITFSPQVTVHVEGGDSSIEERAQQAIKEMFPGLMADFIKVASAKT